MSLLKGGQFPDLAAGQQAAEGGAQLAWGWSAGLGIGLLLVRWGSGAFFWDDMYAYIIECIQYRAIFPR
jgi:hypothetical protein